MRVEGFVQQQISVNNMSDMLARLNIGDVINAKVLAFTANELILRLFDGMTVKAALMEPVNTKAGEFLELSVKAKNENQLILETVKSNNASSSQIDTDIKKKLITMDIKPDENSIEIARELSRQDIPVNKENIQKVVELLSKFKDLNISKSAFIFTSKTAPDLQSIKPILNIIEGRQKLGSEIDILSKLLGDSETKPANTKVVPEKEALLFKLKNPQVEHKDFEASGPIEQAQPEQDLFGIVKKMTEPLVNAGKNTLTVDLPKNDNFKSKLGDYILKAVDFTDVEKEISGYPSIEPDGFKASPAQDKQNIISSVEEFLKKNKSKDMEVHFEEKMDSDIETGRVLVKCRKLLENLNLKSDSENLSAEINVNKLYKDIFKKLEYIKDAISQINFSNKNDILIKIDSMESNIKAMNQINNYNTYVQIPLRIWDKNTTGELYILRRNSRDKRIDPENMTFLISLDTQNMGMIDSLITVNRKNISLNIGVEDKKVIDLFKDNYKDIYESLNEKGYKLVDIKYRLKEEDLSLLNYKDIAAREQYKNRHRIDCRL